MDIKIINFDKMTIKEIEKYHTEQNQILLDMINANCYSKKDIELQKSRVDNSYKALSKKQKKISKIRG